MDFGGTLLTVYAASLVVVLLFVWSATRAARRDDEARAREPALRPAPFPRGERPARRRFAR